MAFQEDQIETSRPKSEREGIRSMLQLITLH
jgi:hypothetical protein